MRIATNIPEGRIIKYLPSMVIIKNYPCRHCIKLNSGKTIFFTGVKSVRDIRHMQFSCVAKTRSEDTYVLAPTLNSDRETTLILLQLEPSQELLSFQQRCLFDFFHWNETRSGTLIAGLAANFPEIYSSDIELLRLNVSTEHKDSCIMDTGYYTIQYDKVEYHMFPHYEEYSTLNLRQIGQFSMHIATDAWKNNAARSYAHPATRFVIDSRNVIFINNKMDLDEISTFLQNENIPSDVVIIWASEEFDAVDCFEEMVKGYVSATTQFRHYIFIGFPYVRTLAIRNYVTRENLKKLTASQQAV